MNDMNKISVIEGLKKEGFAVYPFRGISMYPLLTEGKDMVRLVPFNEARQPREGDVVLFERNDGQLILHRIMSVQGDVFDICGDNCQKGEAVKRAQIIARMEGIYRGTEYEPTDDSNARYTEYTAKKMADYGHRTVQYPVRKEWVQMILLLRAALTGEDVAAFKDANWEELYRLSRKHSITATVFPAIRKELCPHELYEKWKKVSEKNLAKTFTYEEERERLFAEFEKEQIRYVPMKGLMLAELYPAKGMREFADNDILIDDANEERACDLMASLEYRERPTSEEDYTSWVKEPCYNIVLHSAIVEDSQSSFGYFENVMTRIIRQNNSCLYLLNDDDLYCHVIADFEKRSSENGAELRYFADLWLLRRYYAAKGIVIDGEKLKSAGLAEFEAEMTALADKMFTKTNTLTYKDISFVMTSGTHGVTVHSIERGIRKNGKAGFFFSRLFPPYASMKRQYPVLKKYQILLPFMWVARLFTCLFRKTSRQYFRTMWKTVFKKTK